MLYVDQRWVGKHGIGRFATEVLSGISLPYSYLSASGAASSPLDTINPKRWPLKNSDLIYSPGFNAGVSRARQLLTLHDLIHFEAGGRTVRLRRSYYELVVKPAIRRMGSVFTVSETSARYISDWLGDEAVEVVNVGNGCSDVFKPADPRIVEVKEYFLYVGNLKAHKNFSVLLQALKLRPKATLTAVINDHSGAEELVTANGLEGQVRIMSNLDDVALAKVYQEAAGLLLPSSLEGFGLPAVESLACGRPVAFYSNCESVAEIVGGFGLAVSSDSDPEAWAQAMDELICLAPDFVPPSTEWRGRYRWSSVAERVQSHLAKVSGTE